MIGPLARLLRRRQRRVTPALEDRLAALERALGAKMEAQLVVLAQALAEVVTHELAKGTGQLRRELAAQGAGEGRGRGAGEGGQRRPGTDSAGPTARASLLDRAADARAWGARP